MARTPAEDNNIPAYKRGERVSPRPMRIGDRTFSKLQLVRYCRRILGMPWRYSDVLESMADAELEKLSHRFNGDMPTVADMHQYDGVVAQPIKTSFKRRNDVPQVD